MLCYRRVFRKETRSIYDQSEVTVLSEVTPRSEIQFSIRDPAESFSDWFSRSIGERVETLRCENTPLAFPHDLEWGEASAEPTDQSIRWMPLGTVCCGKY